MLGRFWRLLEPLGSLLGVSWSLATVWRRSGDALATLWRRSRTLVTPWRYSGDALAFLSILHTVEVVFISLLDALAHVLSLLTNFETLVHV